MFMLKGADVGRQRCQWKMKDHVKRCRPHEKLPLKLSFKQIPKQKLWNLCAEVSTLAHVLRSCYIHFCTNKSPSTGYLAPSCEAIWVSFTKGLAFPPCHLLHMFTPQLPSSTDSTVNDQDGWGLRRCTPEHLEGDKLGSLSRLLPRSVVSLCLIAGPHWCRKPPASLKRKLLPSNREAHLFGKIPRSLL